MFLSNDRKGVAIVRIHIVQKGDTLWNIAKKYGVDFEELKSVNTQLSNPDMIMPGMKIKVPQGTKPVKKEAPKAQAPAKEMPSAPYKEKAKPIPSIKEDEKKPAPKGVKEKPMQPMQPMQPIHMNMPITMPSIDQQMQNYYTTFHLPQMPGPKPEESPESPESPKEEVKGEQYQPMQQPYCPPMQPQLVHTDYYCCPPYPVMMPMPYGGMPHPMQQPMGQPMYGDDFESDDDMVQGAQSDEDCGCDGGSVKGYGPAYGGHHPGHHPHHPQHPWQQMPYGGMQQPGGWGQPYPQHPQHHQYPQQGWGQQPYQGWGPYPQMGPWNPQQAGQGMPQPWRDDDVDES
nr:SafA/ExsA family spore coat assembly protein [Halobacillus kuroshimensis]